MQSSIKFRAVLIPESYSQFDEMDCLYTSVQKKLFFSQSNDAKIYIKFCEKQLFSMRVQLTRQIINNKNRTRK